MKIKIDIEDKGRTFEKWIDGVRRKGLKGVDKFGRDLVASLKRHSPVDTGEMADSWKHEVKNKSPLISDLSITNSSHSDKGVSVPILVDKGHGLKGGGYVKANPFIKKAVDSVYDESTTRLLEDLLK